MVIDDAYRISCIKLEDCRCIPPKKSRRTILSICWAKAALPLGRMFLLACMAGAFVALAGVASTAAAATVGDPSLAKLISGCVFPAGLAMVIVAGSELFTATTS